MVHITSCLLHIPQIVLSSLKVFATCLQRGLKADNHFKYRTVNESRRVCDTPLTRSVSPPTTAGSLQQQVDSPLNTAAEAVDVKPASAEKDWITRLRGRLADSENPDRPAAVAEGVDKLAGSGKQSPAAGKAVAAAVAEVMPFEQMAYRDEYSFFRNFLSFPRDERQQILQDAFLNPKTEAEKTRLNDIVELINTANTPDEKKAALGALNQNWNSIMTRIEQDYPDQNPTDITLGPDVLSVVLGGKRTSGLHGAGDQLVEQLLEQEDSEVMSFSRSEGSVNDDLKSKRHTHFTSQTSLLEAVAREKGPSTRVVFFYTIGLTGDNGQNEVNNTMVDDLITSFIDRGWLIDPNVFIVHTSTYHASAKTAGHEDNLSANYGLTDYGASKVLQTLQFAAAVYAHDTFATQSDAYKRLIELKERLEEQLQVLRAVWVAAADNKAAGDVAADADDDALKANAALNKSILGAGAAKPPDSLEPFGLPEDAITKLLQTMETAADEVFEDSKGEQSIIVQLQKFSNRFDVMKIPYMLSNTAVYKRMFIWQVSANIGKTPWDFYKICSMKRMRIVQSCNQAASWHIAVAKQLLCNSHKQQRIPAAKQAVEIARAEWAQAAVDAKAAWTMRDNQYRHQVETLQQQLQDLEECPPGSQGSQGEECCRRSSTLRRRRSSRIDLGPREETPAACAIDMESSFKQGNEQSETVRNEHRRILVGGIYQLLVSSGDVCTHTVMFVLVQWYCWMNDFVLFQSKCICSLRILGAVLTCPAVCCSLRLETLS